MAEDKRTIYVQMFHYGFLKFDIQFFIAVVFRLGRLVSVFLLTYELHIIT
jgi:hypothetical protein